MNTKFKKSSPLQQLCTVLGIISLLALSAAPKARADDAGIVWFSSTNTIAANATTTANLGGYIKIDKQHFAALVVRFQGNGSDTANIAVQLQRTADGTTNTLETTPPTTLNFSNALVNTTAVIGYAEIPQSLIASTHSFKIKQVQNYSSTIGATNASIGILIKKER